MGFLEQAQKAVQERKSKQKQKRLPTNSPICTPEGQSLVPHQGKISPERVETILDAMSVGANQSTAAKLAGITPNTLSNWKAKGLEGKEPYRSFVVALEKAEAEFEVECLREIMAMGGWRGRTWILERTKPKKYSNKVEHKHEHDHKHNHKITGFMPDNSRTVDVDFEVSDD